MSRAIKLARDKAMAALSSINDWEDDTRHFPEPNLKENQIYAVMDSNGNRFYARFEFGGGEYWWISPETGSEMSVAKFSRAGGITPNWDSND